MNLIKRIRKYVLNDKAKISDRMFMVISATAIVCFYLSIINALIMGDLRLAAFELVGSIAFSVIIYIGFKRNRLEVTAKIVATILVFLVLPAIFIMMPGKFALVSMGYIVANLYICLVVTGKYRIFLAISEIITLGLCYDGEYRSQSAGNSDVLFSDYVMYFLATVLIAMVVTAIVLFQNYLFKIEQERSDKRRAEVEKLSKSQSRFFSSMSHEIRTPINTIIGLNEMTLREDISDEVAENSKNIQAASKMLLHLINDILDMSKIESGRMDLVPVPYRTGDMFSEIVSMIWIRAREKKLDFHINIDPMLPEMLIGDEVRIKQVLINLLTNAVKYTKEGSVTLSVQYEKKSNRSGVVTYSVADTGIGVKKDSIPYLFAAFKRVDETENRYIEGTGLGLAISKQFVDMMGGTITVNSVYTQGSTFIVSIPQGIEDERGVGELNLEKRHSTGYRHHYRRSFEAPEAKILVVDDTPANLLVVEKLLRDTKVQIDTAESGREALKKTLETGYDLILMDHMMPEMDGIECMHMIQNQKGGLCKDTKVIALTANAGSENQSLYANEGFDGYIVKPVSGEILENEVSRKLPKHLVINTIEDDVAAEDGSEQFQKKRRMRIPVIITSESVCDLPEKYVLEHNVEIIPYHVRTADGDFLDGYEAETRGILSYMSEGRTDARSEEPSIIEYERFFAENLIRANHVIHIAMSSKVGRGCEYAMEAAQTFDNVTVIDSNHLSSGMGLLVMEAVRMVDEGMRADLIVQKIKELRECVNTSFIVMYTNYLTNAGRLNPKVNRVAQALLFRPALTLKKGRMGVGKAYFGSEDYVWKKYVRDSLDVFRKIDRRRVFITHAGLNMEELREIKKEIEKKVIFDEVIFQNASSAVTANCGPGTFGILFMTLP